MSGCKMYRMLWETKNSVSEPVTPAKTQEDWRRANFHQHQTINVNRMTGRLQQLAG